MHRKFRILHRYFGVVAALFIAMLTITGILLNHTDSLQLNKKPITNLLLLNWYGIKPATVIGFRVGNNLVSFDSKNVYFNRQMVSECKSLSGVIWHNPYHIIACEEQIILLNESGELLEIIDKNLGLPIPVDGIGLHNQQIYIKTENNYLLFNIEQLTFMQVDVATLPLSQPERVSDITQQTLQAHSNTHSIHVERLLLDIHSGRFFGNLGVWIVDLGALLLLFMAFSGLWVWFHRYR